MASMAICNENKKMNCTIRWEFLFANTEYWMHKITVFNKLWELSKHEKNRISMYVLHWTFKCCYFCSHAYNGIHSSKINNISLHSHHSCNSEHWILNAWICFFFSKSKFLKLINSIRATKKSSSVVMACINTKNGNN